MKLLIYTEVPLDDDRVQQQLAELDRGAAVTVMVPIRSLNEGEREFIEAEHMVDDDDDIAPKVKFANWRLGRAVEAVRQLGFDDVHGVTSATSPVDSIETAIENDAYDVVVVVTEPVGVAGWVHLDLAHRVERHVEQPVVHIELDPTDRGEHDTAVGYLN